MTNQDAGTKYDLVGRSNSAIKSSRQALFDLSIDVHSHPELNYQEYYSSNALAGFLEEHGLQVERDLVQGDSRTDPAGEGPGDDFQVHPSPVSLGYVVELVRPVGDDPGEYVQPPGGAPGGGPGPGCPAAGPAPPEGGPGRAG